MLGNYSVITVTHQNLNVDEIAHFVVKNSGKEDLGVKLTKVKDYFGIDELIYLSTCNRVTYIFYGKNDIDEDFIKAFFHHINPELPENRFDSLDKFVNIYHSESAINHICEVVSSLDSLVVGEREIYRQFRDAFQLSKDLGVSGDHMRLLERTAVKTAKEVYSKTKIGEKPLSVVYLAVQAMMARKPKLDSRIILIGAGETNTTFGKFLSKYNFTNITIFNRSLDNASTLSEMLNAKAYHLSHLKQFNEGFDIMIACTGSTEAIINAEIYKSLAHDETGKLVIDLSVPRNVDEDVVEHFGPKYIDIEKLRSLAEKNLECRKKEIVVAKKIILEKLEEFKLSVQQRQLEKLFTKVPGEIKSIKERAINQVYKNELKMMDEASLKVLHNMMDYMEKKCIAVPMKVAKELVS